MTEDQNDETTQGPVTDPLPETPPTTATPEVTNQAAVPLPAASPPVPEQPLPLPQQPDTPPRGVAQDATPATASTPPQGTYAMGALAGNPMLGDPPTASFGGPPPTDPGAPMWSTPAAPAPAAASTSHRVRNGLLAGAAALAVLGAGIGIGHATTTGGSSTQAFSPTSGSTRPPLEFRRLTFFRWLRFLEQSLRQRIPLRERRGYRERVLRQHRQHGQRQFGLVELLRPE